MPRDPFAVLGVPLDAGSDAIKAAWRKLAREHHPDLSSGDSGVEKRANRTMAEINAAYHELRDPATRRRHREAAARSRAASGDVERRAHPGAEKSSADGFYDSVAGEPEWPERPPPAAQRDPASAGPEPASRSAATAPIP